jgi:hypothetical protein
MSLAVSSYPLRAVLDGAARRVLDPGGALQTAPILIAVVTAFLSRGRQVPPCTPQTGPRGRGGANSLAERAQRRSMMHHSEPNSFRGRPWRAARTGRFCMHRPHSGPSGRRSCDDGHRARSGPDLPHDDRSVVRIDCLAGGATMRYGFRPETSRSAPGDPAPGC